MPRRFDQYAYCQLLKSVILHRKTKWPLATENRNITNTTYPDHRHTVVSVTSCFSRWAQNLTPCILTQPSNFFTPKFAQLTKSGMSRKCKFFDFLYLSFSLLLFLSFFSCRRLQQNAGTDFNTGWLVWRGFPQQSVWGSIWRRIMFYPRKLQNRNFGAPNRHLSQIWSIFERRNANSRLRTARIFRKCVNS